MLNLVIKRQKRMSKLKYRIALRVKNVFMQGNALKYWDKVLDCALFHTGESSIFY